MTTMARHLFRDSISVYRDTFTVDSVGGRITSIDSTGTAIQCRLDFPTGAERTAAEQRGDKLAYVVYCQFDEDVKRGDRLDHADVRKMRVIGVLKDPLRKYLRLDCELIQGDPGN